ncbi:MAG: helix-hairpin-helix domain-containing protein [Gemmatimonadota bacterium]
MHPSKVDRTRLRELTDLPNVGKETAGDLVLLGINSPSQLEGRDPVALYDELCEKTRTRQDPCVLDVFISLTRFMEGDPPQSWWAYTAERKRMMAALAR